MPSRQGKTRVDDLPREIVPYADAVAMLEIHEGRVHTFRSAGPALVGADWDFAKLTEWMSAREIEKSGCCAQAFNHGLVGTDDHGSLFLATKESDAEG